MPIGIKATGATFNSLKAIALGEHDIPTALELAVGKKFGTVGAAFKSTVPNESVTQGIIDFARGRPVKDAKAKTLIKNILALEGKAEIKAGTAVMNPVNILAALAGIEKDDEKAALRITKLFFLLKQAEYRQADKLVAGYFGGGVRQAVSGGFGEFGKEKYTGFAGMSKAAQLAIDEINKRL